jgi:hypothetical protein
MVMRSWQHIGIAIYGSFNCLDICFVYWAHYSTTTFLLQQTPDATPEEIKKAYYSCMKACHPDLSGNNPDSTDFCMFVNEIYEVLVLSYFSHGFYNIDAI